MRPSLLLAAGLVAVALLAPACGPATTTTTVASTTSGDCPDERAVVRRALDRSGLRVDVDGDGRLDTVAVASRPRAPRPCRGFVGVRLADGSTYSTHLFRLAVPLEGLEASVAGLPSLGTEPGAEIVVDTKAAVDSLLGQVFTLTADGLEAVPVPGFEDGTLIVEGGGVIYPFGAACTSEGRLVLSRAAQTRDGERYRVLRRSFAVAEGPMRFVAPVRERATVPVENLLDRFPEFGRPHWEACTGTVRR